MSEKKGEFYFKFYAGEFLLDEKVDLLPDIAQLLLVKMWCLCCLHGYAPKDPGLLAKRVKMELSQVQLHLQSVMQFFCEVDADRLVSPRLEAEMAKAGRLSKTRADVAKARWDKEKSKIEPKTNDAIASANGCANADANPMQLESEKKIDSSTPPTPPLALGGDEPGEDGEAGTAPDPSAGESVTLVHPTKPRKRGPKGRPAAEALPYLDLAWETFPTQYVDADKKTKSLRLDRVQVEKRWAAILGGAMASFLDGKPATAEELAGAAQFYWHAHPLPKKGFGCMIATFYSTSENENAKNLWIEAVRKIRDLRAQGKLEPARPFDGKPPLKSPATAPAQEPAPAPESTSEPISA